jgi:hypothetical protein
MTTTEIVALVAALVSVFAAVVASWFARRSYEVSASETVDELARTVAKIASAQRSATMQRVRAGVRDMAAGPEGPPELRAVPPPPPASLAELKADLRRRIK